MSRRLPVIGPDTLVSHIGEGVHTGLRRGSESPSAHTLWTSIHELDDGAWGDAVRHFVDGLRFMYPDGFEFDPDVPGNYPKHVLDADSVVWSWNARLRQARGVWTNGAYVPRDSKRLPEALRGTPMTLDMLRTERGPLHAVEIDRDEV